MQYEAPETTKAAVGLLAKAKGSAYVLAGGSDLLVRMKGGFVEPDLVVDIKRIKAMREVKKTASGFVIGAAVSCAEVNENKALIKAWPGVVEAAGLIGSKQVQSRCTMAGNLCNASPAADSVPALVAAGAKAVVQGPKGKRKVAVEDIPVGPGRNSLKKGELIEAIELPARKGKSGDAYLRFIPRTEMDIAVVSAGVSLTLGDKGVIKDARVALGAVAPTVRLVKEAAKAIIGTKLDEAALEKLGKAASAACSPIDDKRGTIEFRTKVAAVLAKRAAQIAYKRAGGK
ncbi:xanthine dehydrogenase family protein subunit M [Aestuariivirga sp.]|uniref:FAD binding domain-containing protein n=1 Tax=Aestuariivirga sp. TaxID=2650926 RepID=UPI0035B22F47